MSKLDMLLDLFKKHNVEYLRENLTRTPVTDDTTGDVIGNFCICYTEDLQTTFGLYFVNKKVLRVFSLPDYEVLFEGRYNTQYNAWSEVGRMPSCTAEQSDLIMFMSRANSVLK